MKNIYKLFIAFILLGISVFLTFWLRSKNDVEFLIITMVLNVVLATYIVVMIINNRSKVSSFNSDLNHKIKTYSSCLIETSDLPVLDDKNIIGVLSFEGLIDTQIEVKKPIYYNRGDNYCVFVLIDNKEACYLVLKEEENVVCDYENYVKRLIKNRENNFDVEMLEKLDKTAVIKLANNKSYKISPIK